MIFIIVARSKNNVIGKGGMIPWKIEGEQRQFKELTTGNAVIMGRKTYEDIGHPLPDRMNIVVSESHKFSGGNVITVRSLAEAIEAAGDRDIFIAGGYRLFKEALPLVDKMYITEVDTLIEGGDVFFPEFDTDEFDLEEGETAGDEIKYTRTVYTRNQATWSKDMKYGMIIVTFANENEAEKITDELLGRKLIACAQLMNIKSRYVWKGEVVRDDEVMVFFKTIEELYEKAEALIKSMHSYEVPEIIYVSIEKGSKEYFGWIDENVTYGE